MHAVVVGGSRGIGLAAAHKFVRNSISVTLVSRNEANLRDAAESLEKINQNKVKIAIQVCDVAVEDDIAKCCRDLVGNDTSPSTKPTVDILVNSAGITLNKLLMSSSAEQIKNVIDTNLYGTILFSKHIAKTMIRQKRGSIINVGSIIGSNGNSGQTIYSASKSALVGFTKSLAKELGPKGITVNLVSPGFINTDMTQTSVGKAQLEALTKHQIPIGRIGTPDEVANVIHFLSTSNFITGHVLTVDGGLGLTL